MATISEDYVSFEIAKLLRDKGFNECCRAFRSPSRKLFYSSHDIKNFEDRETIGGAIAAPTLQMAMKWLREVHNIHIEICLYKTSEDDIEPKKSRKAPYYTFGVWDSITGDNVDKRLTNDFIGNTYEQACEAGIKYCLENLI